MLQASVNESVKGGLQLAVAVEGKFDQSYARDAWGYDDQHGFRSDLNLAMAVQRQMLPRNMKQLPTARYAGLTSAARGVGGDYYDFLDLGPDSLGLVLADVSGKGMPVLRARESGDMYVQVLVETPQKLTKRQKELLQEFEQQSSRETQPEAEGFFAKVKDFLEGLGNKQSSA